MVKKRKEMMREHLIIIKKIVSRNLIYFIYDFFQ